MMDAKIIYYSSPIGLLEIKTLQNQLVGLHFSHSAEIFSNTKKVQPDTALQKKCVQQLDEYFKGSLKQFDLPLHLIGTPFQQSVWNALRTISFGKTTSYQQLSKQLGNTRAIRAVGTANGKNPIAIIIPCHRIIGSNGDLTGYAGELWRKKWLLEHEAKWQNGVQTLF